MNARDVFGMIEPTLADARQKITPLLSVSLDQAKEVHAKAGPVTRIASGLAAGVMAGKVVSSFAR
ncbi:MAG TPA: hypothetical protein VG275_02440 [Solirubrobacteraceae bacterium]|jgi:hypothetical protein|nr:hypothetical protein [Solirubrobacteraceae bacterium]